MRRSERRKNERREDAGARKGRKVAIHYVFPMICGSGRSKSRLAKAAGAEPCGQVRHEKLHAFVPRSTFPSQNVQERTQRSDHFWKLRCRKNCARRCGSFAHVPSMIKKKLRGSDRFWTFRCRKKCTPLWRVAHFEVKSVAKRDGLRPLLEVEHV